MMMKTMWLMGALMGLSSLGECSGGPHRALPQAVERSA
jgi:hypothetical protein